MKKKPSYRSKKKTQKKKNPTEKRQDCYEMTAKYIKVIQSIALNEPKHSEAILCALQNFLEKHAIETQSLRSPMPSKQESQHENCQS